MRIRPPMQASRRSVFPIAFLSLAAGVAYPAGKPSSTSTSRQFIVYGADVRVRGAMCDLAEQTKANLLRLLGRRDSWKTALLLNLEYPRANFPEAAEAHLSFSQLGYGLKLQLDLVMTGEMKRHAVQRELLRAILLEMMYRDRRDTAAGTPYATPPDWLAEGILALQPGRERGDDAELLRSIVASQKIARLGEIVRQRLAQLDAPSRRFYQAYSRALVQLLLDAPGGRNKLGRFISDLPDAPNDGLADLRAHFPDTIGRSPDKWWTLSVAQLSATNRSETLSAPETSARLDRALRFSMRAPHGTSQDYSLGDYETFRKFPSRREVLQQVSRQLLLLSARAHPSYRSIVQEEYELATLLAQGKARGVPARLERIASYRALVERQGREIDDYLNWYEATQGKTMSDAFSDILQTARSADEDLPRRRDPISVYLDSIEMEMD
ncbi:MAG: hypothetical protein ABI540_04390 [Spartobacteria bacterium]